MVCKLRYQVVLILAGLGTSARAMIVVGPRWFVLFGLTVCSSACLSARPVVAEQVHAKEVTKIVEIDYARKIRPILAKKCYLCHGPDEETREADLRLDHGAGSQADLGGYQAITPGDPDESELMLRITSQDEDARMPPADSNLTLTDDEIERLRHWILSGGQYRSHWSLIAPKRPALPKVKQTDWPLGELDYHVLARLEQKGLRPSPEADRYTLIRRVYLDLVGLLPGPQEIDAWIDDTAPDAYERMVDRLLVSPRYGERWARRWLDVARYADTNGYEKDRPRSIWPYRDWVLQAINSGMPFDQFTIEQIAGDMLPHPTQDQIVATGFHRNTMLNEEGGIDPEEFRFYALVDRVNTTGSVWLGLTMGCVQCHTHKYDPIMHEEYYKLLAFYNNADEPSLVVRDEKIAVAREPIEAEAAAMEADLENQFPLSTAGQTPDDRPDEVQRGEYFAQKYEQWLNGASAKAVHWTRLKPVMLKANATTLTALEDDSILASGDRHKVDTYTVCFETELEGITALRLETLTDPSLPRGGPGRGEQDPEGDFFLSDFQVHVALAGSGNDAFKRIDLGKATADYFKPGRPPSDSLDGRRETAWSISPKINEPHAAVYQFSEPIRCDGKIRLKVMLKHEYFNSSTSIGRYRISVTDAPTPVEASGVTADIESVLLVPVAERTTEQQEAVKRFFLQTAPELEARRAEIKQVRAREPRMATTLVMRERKQTHRRITHRHHRGEFTSPREEVTPGVPKSMPKIPEGVEPNRLALAKWLVSRTNPLTARVIMNRAWQAFFGNGLVGTVEDFGVQGDNPTNQDLLDFLAVEFMDRGWRMKEMHRTMVTSATYRQSARVTPELLQLDPNNELLSRGPRFRVEAEVVRDMALTASGLIKHRLGGPSVRPPNAGGITELAYSNSGDGESTGDDRYRRGLYTYWKRTVPYATLVAFDAPTADEACVKRNRSNSPLQALTLLNDLVYIESAQAMAARLVTEVDGGLEDRIRYLFKIALTRTPSERELKALTAYYQTQLEKFQAGQGDAKTIAFSHRECDKIEGVDTKELATWTLVCRVILNLNEMITKG